VRGRARAGIFVVWTCGGDWRDSLVVVFVVMSAVFGW
jgi:hypothetical protein